MANLWSKLEQWYESLAPQEQKVMLLGTPLILFLLCYLVLLQPLGSAYLTQQRELTDRRADLQWIRDQRELLERLNTSCDVRGQIFAPDNLQTEVEGAARRFGVVSVIRPLTAPGQFQLQASNVPGNRILNLVRVLACSGVRVTSIEMQVSGTNSEEVNVTLLMQYAGSAL